MNVGSIQDQGGRMVQRRWRRAVSRGLSLAVGLIVAGVIIVTPWLFGGVRPGVVVWLLAGSAAALLSCVFLSALEGTAAPRQVPLAVVPLLAALGWGGLQIAPLSGPLQTMLSPVGSPLRASLQTTPSPDGSGPASAGSATLAPRYQPISLYPASTRHDLAMLVLATGLFLAGALGLRGQRAQLWLCGLVAVNGALFSLFGIVQQLGYNGKLYWVQRLADGGKPFAGMVNRNNAGGYLNLCLAAALGVAIWAMRRRRISGGEPASDRGHGRLRQEAVSGGALARTASSLDSVSVAALVTVGVLVAGIVCTLSRGATLAMVGATVVTASVVVAAQRRAAPSVAWMAVAAVGGLLLVGWVGYQDSVCARYRGLLDGQSLAHEGRLAHWADSLHAAPDFWRTGSGLGTYRYIYPRYQTRPVQGWFYHAENQYLEALIEGGVPGLTLVICAIVMIGLACRRLMSSGTDGWRLSIGAVGCFALTSQTIHAFLDFGLFIPANMLLFALLCGMTVATAQRSAWKTVVDGARPRQRSRLMPALLSAMLLGATLLGWQEMRRVAAVERSMARSDGVRSAGATAAVDSLRRTVDDLETALLYRPDDAPAQYRAGRLRTQLFRVALVRQLRSAPGLHADGSQLWNVTSPVALYAHWRQLLRRDGLSAREPLRDDRLVREHLSRARAHFLAARQACPFLPRVHLRLAELAFLSGHAASDVAHLRRTVELAPSDPDLLYQCGVLQFHAGRRGMAFAHWNRSLSLMPRHLGDIVQLTRRQVSTDELVSTILPPSPALLVKLAEDRYASEEDKAKRLAIAARAETLLEERPIDQAELLCLRGKIHALQSRRDEAIADYREALLLQSDNIELRFNLARLLAEAGHRDEARRQVETCVYRAPRNQRYRRLLESLDRTSRERRARAPFSRKTVLTSS